MRVERYSAPLRILHHLTAVCFIAALCLVLFGESLGYAEGNVISLHKSFGVSVLALTVLRYGVRFALPYPAPIGSGVLRVLSHMTHSGLYILLLAVPLTGWLKSNTKGYGVEWFGLVPLPNIAAADAAQNAFYSEWHELLGYSALALVGLHVLGVLYHTFVRRDHVLRRMA